MYKSKKWENKRKSILKRDNYMCKECKRFGKSTQANIVHHIYPFEFYPEQALNSKNLISLCSKCHNKMHIRNNHSLTALGKRWKNNTKL